MLLSPPGTIKLRAAALAPRAAEPGEDEERPFCPGLATTGLLVVVAAEAPLVDEPGRPALPHATATAARAKAASTPQVRYLRRVFDSGLRGAVVRDPLRTLPAYFFLPRLPFFLPFAFFLAFAQPVTWILVDLWI